MLTIYRIERDGHGPWRSECDYYNDLRPALFITKNKDGHPPNDMPSLWSTSVPILKARFGFVSKQAMLYWFNPNAMRLLQRYQFAVTVYYCEGPYDTDGIQAVVNADKMMPVVAYRCTEAQYIDL